MKSFGATTNLEKNIMRNKMNSKVKITAYASELEALKDELFRLYNERFFEHVRRMDEIELYRWNNAIEVYQIINKKLDDGSSGILKISLTISQMFAVLKIIMPAGTTNIECITMIGKIHKAIMNVNFIDLSDITPKTTSKNYNY